MKSSWMHVSVRQCQENLISQKKKSQLTEMLFYFCFRLSDEHKGKDSPLISALEGAGAAFVGVGSEHSSLAHHEDFTMLHRGLNCW